MPNGIKSKLEKFLEDAANSDVGKTIWKGLENSVPWLVYPVEGQKKLVEQIKAGEVKPDEIALTSLGINTELSLSELVRVMIYDVLKDPTIKETAETLGVLFTEPFVGVLEHYAEKEDFDAKEMAAAFHGTTMLLKMPHILAKAANNELQKKLLGDVGDAFETIYWNLGLGFMGWQTIAPLLSNGLQVKLDKHYKFRFRPKRFDLETLLYQYHIGQIDKETMRTAAREEGWRDQDIVDALELTYRNLSQNEMLQLYQAGRMTVEDITYEFLKAGYNPQYVLPLVNDLLNTESDKDRNVTVSDAVKAYKNHLLTLTEFRTLLSELGFGDNAIKLKVALVNSELERDARELSLSQVREAFVLGQLAIAECVKFLSDLGYEANDIDLIMRTWRAAKQPKILTLNRSAIVSAFTAGILTRGEAYNRLIEIGWKKEDAKIILDTAIVKGAKSSAKVSLGYLMQGLSTGAVQEREFLARVEELDYGPEDARLLLRIAQQATPPDIQERHIEQAYKAKVINDATATTLLQTLGQSQEAIRLKLDTWAVQRAKLQPKVSAPQLALMFRQGILDENGLRKSLAALDLSDYDINLLVQSAKNALPQQLTESNIGDLYYLGVIDANRASQLLREIGFNGTDANLLVEGYNKVLVQLNPRPSASQYIQAFRDGLISEGELVGKLNELGYNPEAVAFYVEWAKQPEPTKTKNLSDSNILGLYEDGFITRQNAIERLTINGYSLDDAELLVKRKEGDVKETDESNMLTGGIQTPESLITTLSARGYTEQQIEAFVNNAL